MKNLLIILLMTLPLLAQERPHDRARVWARRVSLVGSCAANLAWDTYTTRHAENAGAVESNPLLANGQGHPQWGRFISLKVGMCGATAFVQERWHSPASDWTWTGVNAATAAGFTVVGFHNLAITK